MIEKLKEMLFFCFYNMGSAFSWVIKTVKSDIKSAHKCIDDMERRIITKENLKSALSPLRNEVNLILKTLLDRKK